MAKLILITGAQAVGKMTVGEALKEKTGFALTINHDSLDLAAKIYGWGTPAHRQLSNKIREETFRAAIDNNVDLIFTYIWAFNEQSDWEYIDNLNKMFNGELYIVELFTDLKTRIFRNTTEHRLEVKPTKRRVEESNNNLLRDVNRYRLISNDGEVSSRYPNYIKLDNTNLSPEEVANIIIERFSLTPQETIKPIRR